MTATRRARPPRATLLLLAALLAAGASRAAPRDDDLARRTLDNAEQLMREGKVEQALRDFEQVYTAYADSGLADDALYRVASYYYPVETMDALGTVPEGSIAKARALFERIKTKYPGEDRAAPALLKLGLIALDPSNPSRSLDEAYASFSGVVNIYPASAEVDRALFGAGYADFLAGRYDKAIGSFERVAEEFPRGMVAEDARYYAGLAQMNKGAWIRALEELQTVRNLFPGGRLGGRALDRLTQIYKLKVQPGLSGRPLFVHDASYAPALPPESARGDVSLAVDGTSALHLLDTRTGALVRLDHEGRLLSTGAPFSGASWVSVDPAGTEVVAAGGRLRSGMEVIAPSRQDGSTLRPMEKLTAAVKIDSRQLALLDDERNEVLLYAGDPAKLKPLYRDPSGRARLTGLASGAAGKLYTIDRRARRVIEIAPDGTSREIAVGTAGEQEPQDPVALAADDIGDLYVLDRRAGAVVVMTVEGKILQRIASQPGTAAEFASPTALALGPRAEIYVHDAKRRTILRFW